MGVAVLDDILNGTVTAVNNLGFVLNANPIPVVKRKLPKKDETIDPPTQITVCRSDAPEGFKRMAFGRKSKAYLVLITIISPNNDDQITNLPIYSQWREQIVNLYAPDGGFAGPAAIQALAGSALCWDIRPKPGVFLDRQQLAQNYDYQVVGIEFSALA